MSFFYKLFYPHFVFLTEQELMDKMTSINPVYYESDRIYDYIKSFLLDCHCCGRSNLETEKDVNVLLGNRAVDIYVRGICPSCKAETRDQVRLRDGFLMKKINDKWIVAIPREPLIKEFFFRLLGFLGVQRA